MRVQLFKFWDRVRSSFWFIPAVMAGVAVALALGTFIATFLYCLVVLRTIRRVEEVTFVPHLSVTLGVLLAVVSVGVFIYFIHHVSVSIQANEIAARIGEELIDGINCLFPEQMGRGASRISVESPGPGFPEVFNQIRQYGRSSVAVTIRLLETIIVVAGFAHRAEDRATLLRHAEMIARGANKGLPEDQDRRSVEARYQAVRKLCSEPAESRHE